jgi:ubiquinone/menaquinone biosynthesis C-methylase UbiE
VSFIFVKIYDRFMRASEDACLKAWRETLLAQAEGAVLELGAGTGANLPYYGAGVKRLVLSEPDSHMHRRLEQRCADAGHGPRSIELLQAGAEALPFADASFDFVVSTLVLCSVNDIAAALHEVKRVLRPNGSLLYLEHVAAPEDSKRRRWQARVEPLWKRLAGNCHLTRLTSESIRKAGFSIESERAESMRKAMPLLRPTVRGHARNV